MLQTAARSGLRRAGPAITPLDALRRLAGERTLLLLDGGGAGPSLLSWGVDGRRLCSLCDLPDGRGAAPIVDGWPEAPSGGHIVQLDYEFPVGPWGQSPAGGCPRGCAWPLERYLSWTADGRCSMHAASEQELDAMERRLERSNAALARPQLRHPLRAAWSRSGHIERVEQIKRWIAAGDIYQANLTAPICGQLRPAPHNDIAIFAILQRMAAGRHAAFLRSNGRTVISHSPECFLSCDGLIGLSEPIKGTRARRVGEEARLRAELAAAGKDNAELAMIVDLVRNDLGRIARPGGVWVESPAEVIDLPYVHHLVARIACELRSDLGLRDLLAATFPAGSITGAPKIRAMELLRRVEHGARGPYCGSIGWYGAGARCALSVAIRTLTLAGDRVRLHAGGGIVADSDGAAEWDELRAKAAPMAAAVGGGL